MADVYFGTGQVQLRLREDGTLQYTLNGGKTWSGLSASGAVTNAGGVPSILADTEANRPSAGTAGRLFVATDTLRIYRDNGADWDELSPPPTDYVTNAGGVPSIQAGTEANRPAAGNAGRLFVATDTLRLYRDNGAGWDEVSPQATQEFVGARVYHTANQTVNNNTYTPLVFNSERLDTHGFHDPATNNSRLTVPAGRAGRYLIGGHVYWQLSGTGFREIRIRINGADYVAPVAQPTDSSSGVAMQTIVTMVELADGDYAELVAYQNCGSALTINTVPQLSPEFWIAFLG